MDWFVSEVALNRDGATILLAFEGADLGPFAHLDFGYGLSSE